MGLMDTLRKSRNSRTEALEKLNVQKYQNDEFYVPKRDKNNDAASVILRFLPQKDFSKLPLVVKYSHFFKGNDSKWKIVELCPTTIGKPCPICEKNTELWRTETKENRAIASSRKRRKEYICNVLIINDPESPEKNGTVQVYKFGPAIFNKLQSAIKPTFEDDPKIDPFDLLDDGANFNLRVYKDKAKNQYTYEDSKFLERGALFDKDEEKLQNVIDKLIDLDQFVSSDLIPDNERFDYILQTGYNVQPQFSQNTQVMHSAPPTDSASVDVKFDTPTSESNELDDVLNEFRALVG